MHIHRPGSIPGLWHQQATVGVQCYIMTILSFWDWAQQHITPESPELSGQGPATQDCTSKPWAFWTGPSNTTLLQQALSFSDWAQQHNTAPASPELSGLGPATQHCSSKPWAFRTGPSNTTLHQQALSFLDWAQQHNTAPASPELLGLGPATQHHSSKPWASWTGPSNTTLLQQALSFLDWAQQHTTPAKAGIGQETWPWLWSIPGLWHQLAVSSSIWQQSFLDWAQQHNIALSFLDWAQQYDTKVLPYSSLTLQLTPLLVSPELLGLGPATWHWTAPARQGPASSSLALQLTPFWSLWVSLGFACEQSNSLLRLQTSGWLELGWSHLVAVHAWHIHQSELSLWKIHRTKIHIIIQKININTNALKKSLFHTRNADHSLKKRGKYHFNITFAAVLASSRTFKTGQVSETGLVRK